MSTIKKQTVFIREPTLKDQSQFLSAMEKSQKLHDPWVKSPQTAQEFSDYIQRYQQNNQKSYVVYNDADSIVGVFNVSEIVRGFFQSAYLGFYAVSDYAGQGYMSAGLKVVLQHVFEVLKLHRGEANIQPENARSIHLVKNNGFRKEGYSIGYLKINGEWRDHERWAITVEDWNK
jgi:RimJ/RimL family protein N-acetyltransferase